ncbi:MAG: sigma factor-like helix-turn-helix DNA-binding protein [Sphingopyxis sp.]
MMKSYAHLADWVKLCQVIAPDPVAIAQALLATTVRPGTAGAGASAADEGRVDPVEQLLIRSQGAALLALAIEELNIRERVILHFAYVEGKSLEEVAVLLDIGISRIYLIKRQSLSRLHRSMGSLSF